MYSREATKYRINLQNAQNVEYKMNNIYTNFELKIEVFWNFQRARNPFNKLKQTLSYY